MRDAVVAIADDVAADADALPECGTTDNFVTGAACLTDQLEELAMSVGWKGSINQTPLG